MWRAGRISHAANAAFDGGRRAGRRRAGGGRGRTGHGDVRAGRRRAVRVRPGQPGGPAGGAPDAHGDRGEHGGRGAPVPRRYARPHDGGAVPRRRSADAARYGDVRRVPRPAHAPLPAARPQPPPGRRRHPHAVRRGPWRPGVGGSVLARYGRDAAVNHLGRLRRGAGRRRPQLRDRAARRRLRGHELRAARGRGVGVAARARLGGGARQQDVRPQRTPGVG